MVVLRIVRWLTDGEEIDVCGLRATCKHLPHVINWLLSWSTDTHKIPEPNLVQKLLFLGLRVGMGCPSFMHQVPAASECSGLSSCRYVRMKSVSPS